MNASFVLEVIVQGVLNGLVYGLMALGLSVIFGVVRVVNFAHGEFTVAAMYAAFLLFTWFGVDPLVAMVPIALAFFAIGYGLQVTLVHRFVGRAEHEQFILLVGLAIIVDKVRLYAASAALAVAAALFLFFRFTRTGTAIRACADNLVGAAVVGLDVRRLYALTFGLGLACVGAAGALMETIADAKPELGPVYTLIAFIIVIVGGLGSMAGALIGGVLIGVSEALAGLFLAPSMKSMVSFALLIIVLVLRPQGIMGRRA